MNAENFKKNFQLSILLPSLTAGLINAIIMISIEISFAALIFSGDLQPFLPRGIGILLLGTFFISIIVALTSSLVGMAGVPQDTPAAFMAESPTVYRLTTKTLIKVQQEDPAVASSLHEWLGRLLAERLADSNHLVESLLD